MARDNTPIAGYRGEARYRGRRAKRARARTNRIFNDLANYKSASAPRSVRRSLRDANRYTQDIKKQDRLGFFTNPMKKEDEQPAGGDSTNSPK